MFANILLLLLVRLLRKDAEQAFLFFVMTDRVYILNRESHHSSDTNIRVLRIPL